MFGTPGPPIILYVAIVGGMTKTEVRATFTMFRLLTVPVNCASSIKFGIYQGT